MLSQFKVCVLKLGKIQIKVAIGRMIKGPTHREIFFSRPCVKNEYIPDCVFASEQYNLLVYVKKYFESFASVSMF